MDVVFFYLQIKKFEAEFLPRSLRVRGDWISVFGRRGPRASKRIFRASKVLTYQIECNLSLYVIFELTEKQLKTRVSKSDFANLFTFSHFLPVE